MIIPKLPSMKPSDQIQLTDADKARYEKRIAEIDLSGASRDINIDRFDQMQISKF